MMHAMSPCRQDSPCRGCVGQDAGAPGGPEALLPKRCLSSNVRLESSFEAASDWYSEGLGVAQRT